MLFVSKYREPIIHFIPIKHKFILKLGKANIQYRIPNILNLTLKPLILNCPKSKKAQNLKKGKMQLHSRAGGNPPKTGL